MISQEGRRYAERLETKLVEFCRLLRDAKLSVTPSETIDAVRAVGQAGFSDEQVFHDALRICVVKRSEDFETFEKEFRSYWQSGRKRAITADWASKGRRSRRRRADESRRASLEKGVATRAVSGSSSGGTNETRRAALGVFSPLERTQRKSFDGLGTKEVPSVRRALKRMTRRLATNRGRRSIASRGGRIDLGRTFRSALGRGELLTVERENRIVSRIRLVVLCDISGSMDGHSDRLVKILHQSANRIPASKVFVFSTRLSEIGDHLKGRSLRSAASEVSRNVEIWSSGTRIGSALERLLDGYSRYLGSHTVLLIISDGWELGELDLLTDRMREVRRRVSKVVWVNPLADSPGFEPAAAGMKAALPNIDFLGGLDIFTRPREFERVFGKAIGPGPAWGAGRTTNRQGRSGAQLLPSAKPGSFDLNPTIRLASLLCEQDDS
ncbi:MAG: VWA domain-containing protein [Thaumarchaeota archaeon]|nr:VWA domain-containing protein [Nitrososphaerota archaeon]